MFNIGIITIQSDNFGNRLQNYAVQEILLKHGNKVLTYKRKYYYNKKHLLKILLSFVLRPLKVLTKVQWISKKIKNVIAGASHIYYMNHFTVEWIGTSKVYAEEINNKEIDSMDFFVCGSDQLWNPKFPMVSDVDFLQFAHKEQNIAISASIGIAELSSDEESKFRERLKNFKAISVREKQAKELIEPLCDIKIDVLLDPTLMLGAKQWQKIENRVKTPEKYIVVYLLDYKGREKVMSVLEKAYNLDIPEIVWILDKKHPEYYWYGPSEFLYVIHNADAVFTDSFHGTVFSVIFERKVWVFERKHNGYSMNSRITSLVDTLGLPYNIIINNDLDINNDIDFSIVKKNLKREQEKFENYLVSNLVTENE